MSCTRRSREGWPSSRDRCFSAYRRIWASGFWEVALCWRSRNSARQSSSVIAFTGSRRAVRDPALQIAEVDFVNAALALQAVEARLLECCDFVQRFRAVMIAHRDVAFLPERVIGQTVLREITMHVAVGPFGDRVHFPAAA